MFSKIINYFKEDRKPKNIYKIWLKYKNGIEFCTHFSGYEEMVFPEQIGKIERMPISGQRGIFKLLSCNSADYKTADWGSANIRRMFLGLVINDEDVLFKNCSFEKFKTITKGIIK